MCAIYTAWPPGAPVDRVPGADEARAAGLAVFGLGRLAVMRLAERHMPASHAATASALARNSLYMMFQPQVRLDPITLQLLRTFGISELPSRDGEGDESGLPSLWPASPVLACLLGTPPGRWFPHPPRSPLRDGAATVAPELVAAAARELPLATDDDLDASWRKHVHEIHARGDALVIHWEMR